MNSKEEMSWKILQRPVKEDGKFYVRVTHAWTNEVMEEFEFDEKGEAKDFYKSKAKNMAFRGLNTEGVSQ